MSFKIALLVIKYQTEVLKLSITSAKVLSRLLSQMGFGRNITATFVVFSWHWTESNRKQKSYFTVAWPCPGTTGQEKKCFGPISASGAPRRDKQEFSWCQTARIQSMILHTGSHGGGTFPLNCKKKRCLTWRKTSAANTFLETPRRLVVFFPAILLLWKSGTVKNRSNFFMEYTEVLY